MTALETQSGGVATSDGGASRPLRGESDHAIVYCRRCLIPETKPDIFFDDEGVCSACRHYEGRGEVDWDARRAELDVVLERYRSKSGTEYDCIIGVSGGKDSTTQVIRMLELGMNPLCVTATTDELSDIGRRNIENLKGLGVDFIEYTTNQNVRRRINKLALCQVGDISWPEHVTIFTLPVRLAVQMGIKLIVWGENPQNEYGGPAAAATGNTLTRRWLEEFGGLLGLRVSDLVGQAGVENRHLVPYTYPSDEDLAARRRDRHFSRLLHAVGRIAERDLRPVVRVRDLAGNHRGFALQLREPRQPSDWHSRLFQVHQVRVRAATDIASMHVRRGRLQRADALELVKRHDGAFPWTYLGKPIEEVLANIDMSFDEFIAVCDRFTNKRLFETDHRGELVRDDRMELTKINYDNVT